MEFKRLYISITILFLFCNGLNLLPLEDQQILTLEFLKNYLSLRRFHKMNVWNIPCAESNAEMKFRMDLSKEIYSSFLTFTRFLSLDGCKPLNHSPLLQRNISLVFHSTDSALNFIQILRSEDALVVREILQTTGHRVPDVLIFINENVLHEIPSLPININNKIVFAVGKENRSKISLFDYYRTTPEGFIHKTLLGEWSLNSKEIGTPAAPPNSHSQTILRKEDFSILKLRQNWTGLFIRCQTIEAPPYIILRRTSSNNVYVSGSFGFVWNELQKTLNFSYECIEFANSEYGIYDEEEKLWNGIVGNLVYNNSDIALASLTILQSRVEVIDFLEPLLTEAKKIYYRKITDMTEDSWKNYVAEFSLVSWVMILVSFVVSLCLFEVISRLSPYECPSLRGQGFITIIGIFANTSTETKFRSTSGRLFILSISILVILLYAHYTSFLISHLTFKEYKVPFSSLEGLLETDYKLVLKEAISTIDYFRYSSVPLYRRIWEEKLKPNVHLFPRTDDEMKEILLKDKFTSISQFSKDFLGNLSCQFYEAPLPLIDIDGWAIRKGSPLKPFIDYHIRKHLEMGLYSREIRKLERKEDYQTQKACQNESENAIELPAVFIVIMILFMGLVSSFFILAMENVYQKLLKSNSHRVRRRR